MNGADTRYNHDGATYYLRAAGNVSSVKSPDALEQVQPDAGGDPRPRAAAHSRRRRSHHRRRRGQHIALILGLGALLLLTLVLTLFGALKINSLTATNDLLQARLQQAEQQVIDMRKDINRTESLLAAAVEGRFPQLRRLEFDQVLPIHEAGVKNILFTLIKKSETNLYEYKIVMENDTETLSVPDITVLLFSELGVQLGVDKVPKQEPLLRGEARSYSAVVDLLLSGEPRYFYVTITVD